LAHARIFAVSWLPPPEAARALPRAHRGTAAGTAPALGVGLEQTAELVRISSGEVDLVSLAVQRERHGLIRFAAVEVIDKKDLNLLCHRDSLSPKMQYDGKQTAFPGKTQTLGSA
jgi:hypothetical protein